MQVLVAKRHKHLILIRGILAFIACLAALKLIGHLYFLVLSTHYSSYVPASFEIKKTVFAGDQIGGFIEGCGVAVFELSEKTSANVSAGGIAFLDKNSMTRESKHKQYENWQKTPFIFARGDYSVFGRLVSEDAGGNTCVDIPDALKKGILSAIESPGAFHSGFNKNTELMVIPTLRLAVFSHDR